MGLFSFIKKFFNTGGSAVAFTECIDEIGLNKADAIWETLIKARFFEQKVFGLYLKKKIKKWGLSGYYQEAGPSVITTLLDTNDWLIPPYRGFAHVIGKGLPLNSIAAEILGKEAGVMRGRGNPGNYTSPELGIYPNSDVLGNNFPTAVGMGLASKYKGERRVVVSFFGDGAATRSVLYGSLNLSAIWDLPILWVCENNQYSVSTHVSQMTVTSFAEKAASFGVRAFKADGNDISKILPVALRAIQYVRQEQKPAFVELETYRIAGHDSVTTNNNWFQIPLARARWFERDPVKIAEECFLSSRLKTGQEIAESKKNIAQEVENVFQWAERQKDLTPEEVLAKEYEY